MAGSIRIKVSPQQMSPFWMFVNVKECPCIVDIQQKIEQRMVHVTVSSLFLEGCLLPADETSALLRDNDEVTAHVIATESGVQSAASLPHHQKKNRKRKCTDEDSPSVSGQDVGQEMNISTLERKKKKKSRKGKQNNASTCHELSETQHIDHKEKDEKRKKKEAAEQATNGVFSVEGGDASKIHSIPVVSKSSEIQIDTNIKQKASDKSVFTINKSVDEIVDLSVVKKNKKRRKRKKQKAKNQEEARQDIPVAKKTPVEVRIPKWQQAKNKIVRFSSDDESPKSSASGMLETHDQQTVDSCKNVKIQTSRHPSIGDYDNVKSFGDSFPKEVRGEPNGSTVSVTSIKNMSENMNGTASVKTSSSTETENCMEMEKKDEWHRHQQYQEKLIEQKNKLRHSCAAAIDKAIYPVHPYTGGQPESNLVEYLKMSPEERGVKVHPYVKSSRLSNGAMLYTRSPVTACMEEQDQKTTSPFIKPTTSPCKRPGAYPPSKFSLNKKQQNSPGPQTGVSTKEREEGMNGTSPSGQREHTADGQETIILTPLYRDYALFADLTVAPKVGDHIAYKVLEMGENYLPGISEYKEAEVLACDSSGQSVTVRLHHVAEKKTPGRFDLPEEESAEEVVTLEFSSMFEPKLISAQ